MAFRRTKQENINEIAVAQAVAAHAVGIPIIALVQDKLPEDPKVLKGRQLGMYLARTALKRGLRETARAFGRSHPTVLHACRRIEEAREDPTFDRTVEWLETLTRRAAGVTA